MCTITRSNSLLAPHLALVELKNQSKSDALGASGRIKLHYANEDKQVSI